MDTIKCETCGAAQHERDLVFVAPEDNLEWDEITHVGSLVCAACIPEDRLRVTALAHARGMHDDQVRHMSEVRTLTGTIETLRADLADARATIATLRTALDRAHRAG